MSELAQRFKNRYYRNEDHPYEIFERRVRSLLRPGDTLLDAGCGRTAPVLRGFSDTAGRLIGVDLVDPREVPTDIEYHQCNLSAIPVDDGSIDLIMSRSVFEHLTHPAEVYREAFRMLRPGGHLVFLTASDWDYGTMVARLVPNRWHGRVVRHVEGRLEEDTFPTAYKSNSQVTVERLAQASGLRVADFRYLNQYPNYLMFNGALFLLGVGYERLTSRFHALRRLRGWILVTLQKP